MSATDTDFNFYEKCLWNGFLLFLQNKYQQTCKMFLTNTTVEWLINEEFCFSILKFLLVSWAVNNFKFSLCVSRFVGHRCCLSYCDMISSDCEYKSDVSIDACSDLHSSCPWNLVSMLIVMSQLYHRSQWDLFRVDIEVLFNYIWDT